MWHLKNFRYTNTILIDIPKYPSHPKHDHTINFNEMYKLVMCWTPFYRTSNELEHHFSNMFIHWSSNSNTIFLASNDRTSNFEPKRASTRFTKLLFELSRTSLFRTSNELERVHLLVIELEHHIFGYERSNIELRT